MMNNYGPVVYHIIIPAIEFLSAFFEYGKL